MKKLRDKVAIITGAAGGIGAATAELFARQGAKLVLADLDLKALKKVAASLRTQDVRVIAVDVASARDNKRMVEKAVREFGGVDILFANAGIEGKVAPLAQVKDQDFERVLSINLKGVWYALKEVVPPMRKRGGGAILMTSSIAGLRGFAGLGPYTASKHAIIGLMRAAAQELGPDQIRVNTINPGPVDNRMMRSVEKQLSPKDPKAVQAGFLGKIPLGRYADNQDVAELALFLASREGRYLTGQTFVVDGGFTA